jgi:hypothetical protein
MHFLYSGHGLGQSQAKPGWNITTRGKPVSLKKNMSENGTHIAKHKIAPLV